MAHRKSILAGRSPTVRTVIADASPLIALSLIGRLDLLRALFGQASVLSAVRDEVLGGHFARSEKNLHEAFDAGWLKMVDVAADSPAPKDREITPLASDLARIFPAELDDLDAGEAASLRYAAGLSEPALLLMDEAAGRRVAAMMNLAVAGTAALIGMAKQRGLIASAKVEFSRLHAANFWIGAAVIRTVLAATGED